jgi:hypothetical protein
MAVNTVRLTGNSVPEAETRFQWESKLLDRLCKIFLDYTTESNDWRSKN